MIHRNNKVLSRPDEGSVQIEHHQINVLHISFHDVELH